MNIDTRMPLARELGDERLQVLKPVDHVQTAFGGAFGPLFRHEAARVRTKLKRNVEHGLGRRHLEIERLADRRLEAAHVVVVNVSAVLAQMRGDAVGAGVDRHERRADRIGARAAARVAHGRDMIDVDAEPERCHRIASLSSRNSPPIRRRRRARGSPA